MRDAIAGHRKIIPNVFFFIKLTIIIFFQTKINSKKKKLKKQQLTKHHITLLSFGITNDSYHLRTLS